jgi:hypothetical protein
LQKNDNILVYLLLTLKLGGRAFRIKATISETQLQVAVNGTRTVIPILQLCLRRVLPRELIYRIKYKVEEPRGLNTQRGRRHAASRKTRMRSPITHSCCGLNTQRGRRRHAATRKPHHTFVLWSKHTTRQEKTRSATKNKNVWWGYTSYIRSVKCKHSSLHRTDFKIPDDDQRRSKHVVYILPNSSTHITQSTLYNRDTWWSVIKYTKWQYYFLYHRMRITFETL